LVDHLDEDTYVWGIPRAQDELEALLGAKVDVGEVSCLRPSVRADAFAHSARVASSCAS
jgi:predicted nucleotidyltransferase